MRAPRLLGVGAMLLAGAALVAGLGAGSVTAGPGAIGVQELRRELASGAPFVDALTLGEWIRDRDPLRVVDVQGPGAHTRFAIPTARHAGRRELLALERSGAPIIVYDEGTGEAARAWLLLRRLGHPRVHILEGGVLGWIDGVLEPVLPAGTAEEKAAWDRTAAVSRYFGGIPRVGTRPERATDPTEAVQLLSRRGCY